MPDPRRESVSATEASVLLGASPYQTEYMLYHQFKGAEIPRMASPRMEWGLKMQPLVLQQAAEDLALEIKPNQDGNGEIYWRRGVVGATRDATVFTPDKGPGAFETKCCFDDNAWFNSWNNGVQPPKHAEIQLQQQMLVGDGNEPFQHGTIAVWYAGEQFYFYREPIPALWEELERRASAFLGRVKSGEEPSPTGDPKEAPILARLFNPPPEVIADLSSDQELAEMARRYEWLKREERASKKEGDRLRTMIQMKIGNFEKAILPDGIEIRLKAVTVKAHQRAEFNSIRMTVKIPREGNENE